MQRSLILPDEGLRLGKAQALICHTFVRYELRCNSIEAAFSVRRLRSAHFLLAKNIDTER